MGGCVQIAYANCEASVISNRDQSDIYKPDRERVRVSIVGDEVTLRSTAHADIRSE